MRYAFVPLAFGLGANAYVARANTQCFKLSASGGASGVLGQLDDGQNRVGGGHPTGCYCLDGNGSFTDSNGRGCILTPPTTQFQCDVGATPTNGFAVSSSGSVTYNSSGKFYACPVNENGEYNVYTTPAPGQTKCVEITLGSAGSCGAGASQPATTAPAPSAPAPSQPVASGTCPQDLYGNYQYPHLIVPVDSEHPDKAYGTSYNGTISAHICTIFNFDIPTSYAGKKCSTMFMLPKKEDLETSDYTISGQGQCTVSKVNGNANTQTTWNNAPAKARDIASLELSPGNTYPVESGDCEAGKTVSYEICGSGDFSIDYFQDYNPSPIGLYVRQC